MSEAAELAEAMYPRDGMTTVSTATLSKLRERSVWYEVLKTIFDANWPTQSEAARFVSVHPAQINRAIKRGKIDTNGQSGRECRVEPVSLLKYESEREYRRLSRHQRTASS